MHVRTHTNAHGCPHTPYKVSSWTPISNFWTQDGAIFLSFLHTHSTNQQLLHKCFKCPLFFSQTRHLTDTFPIRLQFLKCRGLIPFPHSHGGCEQKKRLCTLNTQVWQVWGLWNTHAHTGAKRASGDVAAGHSVMWGGAGNGWTHPQHYPWRHRWCYGKSWCLLVRF